MSRSILKVKQTTVRDDTKPNGLRIAYEVTEIQNSTRWQIGEIIERPHLQELIDLGITHVTIK